MNKKSFLCGVFVGVLVTWALSFYLYYSLNNSQQVSQLTALQKNVFNFDEEESPEESDEIKGSNFIEVNNDKFVDSKQSYFKSKLKKEKEKRKISRNLIEELTPVTIKQDAEFGLIKSLEDQHIRDSGYKTHAFNALVSNNIGPFREIPDTRHKM